MSFCTELDTTIKACPDNAAEFQWNDEKLPLYITVTNGEKLNIDKIFYRFRDEELEGRRDICRTALFHPPRVEERKQAHILCKTRLL